MDKTWRKSSYSANEPSCVETRHLADAPLRGTVGIRDTKDRARASLAVTGNAWQAFVDHVK